MTGHEKTLFIYLYYSFINIEYLKIQNHNIESKSVNGVLSNVIGNQNAE